jgi:hypothetical protein
MPATDHLSYAARLQQSGEAGAVESGVLLK